MFVRHWSSVGGVLLTVAVFASMRYAGMPDAQCITAAVTTLCATWWIFETLPLPATSLLPLVVFPLTGVLTEREAAAAYGDPIVLLFMGGFMLSKAAERWGAHRRIAEMMLARIFDCSLYCRAAGRTTENAFLAHQPASH